VGAAAAAGGSLVDKRFALVMWLVLCPTVTWAADFYVSQSGAGLVTGTSCADAKSLAWANDAANYGGAGEPTAGDTIHLCGTFTSNLVPPVDGAAGSYLTYRFEPGANFTAPKWEAGAIRLFTRDYIIIDGGNAPVPYRGRWLASCSTLGGYIRSTEMGTTRPYNNVSSFGINIAGLPASNIIIKNLTIVDTYVRAPEDTTPSPGFPGTPPTAIYNAGATEMRVEYSCLKNQWNGVQRGGTLIGNYIESFANGILVGADSNQRIDGNVVKSTRNFLLEAADHVDGVQGWTDVNPVANITVINNELYDETGQGTCMLFMEAQRVPPETGVRGGYDNVLIANNYFYSAMTTIMSNGFFSIGGFGYTNNIKVINNTFMAPYLTDDRLLANVNSGVGHGPLSNYTIVNNLFVRANGTYPTLKVPSSVDDPETTGTNVADYNLHANVDPATWAEWRGTYAKEEHGASYGEPTDTYPVFALTPNEKLVGYCARISGHLGAPEISPGGATGTSVTPNPPAFDPSWATADTLWFAMYAAQNATVTANASAFPANYTNPLTANISGGGGIGAGIATRTANVASEDPGTFTLVASGTWIAATVAVRPSGAAPPTLHSLTQCGTNPVDDPSHRVTPMPVGLQAGDLWLLFTAIDNTGGALTYVPPAYSGWTEVGSLGTDPKIWVWYKIATHVNQLAFIPTIGLLPASVAIGAGMPRSEPELQNDRMGCPRGVDAWTVGADNGTCRRGGH
jgi:hypothetical protein